jgi:glycosyltransferase involved in cell wall biosynthesis
VIPAHNCAALIGQTVTRLADRLSDRSAEIIVVENGSTDNTLARCHELAETWRHPSVALVVTRSDKGMGNALRAGIAGSRGSSVLLTADDLPFGFDDLDAADQLAADGNQQLPPMIIGSKAHPQSDIRRGAGRNVLTSGFAIMRRWLLRSRVGDSQGTFVVDGDLIRGLVPRLSEPGFLFTTELVHVAERSGVSPVEVPVRLSQDHRAHPSRISMGDVARMGVGLLRLRWRHRRDAKEATLNLERDRGPRARGAS